MTSRLISSTTKFPIYVGGEAVLGSHLRPVIDKFTLKPAALAATATADQIEKGITAAYEARDAMKALPSYARRNILMSMASQLLKRKDEFINAIVVEVGKPVADAAREVTRAISVFEASAEEAVRRQGDFYKYDSMDFNKGLNGIVVPFPIGLVSMITPFNFPLNLAAHKVGPAIAAGCPFVLKPSDFTPLSTSLLGDVLAKAGMPKGSFSILPCEPSEAARFSIDPRFAYVSFTGSPGVGWKIKTTVPRAKVCLELGGNAAVIVDAGTDTTQACSRIVLGAFGQMGQSCISVQRVYAHESLYDDLVHKMVQATTALVSGDPLAPSTHVGPMITVESAHRIDSWVKEAVSQGASVLTGGRVNGAFYEPTVLVNVPPTAKVSCQEVFGPVCIVEKYSSFEAALSAVNNSEFGLQAGVFTPSMKQAWMAFERLDVGGVVIDDIPSIRADAQPYGGVKASGLGREGIKWAIEDMSEPKVMLFRS